MGSGQPRDGDGDDEDDDTEDDVVNYRGTMPKDEWLEFKSNVPRTMRLMDKVNELIRQFNDEQRDSENENDNNPNNQDT